MLVTPDHKRRYVAGSSRRAKRLRDVLQVERPQSKT